MAELNGTNSPGASQPQTQPPAPQEPTSSAPPDPSTTQFHTPGTAPRTSATDTGTTTRPRDARTIHMVLAALGVTAYQERVPLQLLDFAYRYTSSVLSDAANFSAEGYMATTTTSNARGGANNNNAADGGNLSIQALRLAASSRPGYQFTSVLPKETMLELAAERNRIKLPAVDRDVQFGVRLPHERFVLTGTGWNLPEEWDSEGEDGTDGVDGDAGIVDGMGDEMAGANGTSQDGNGEKDEDEDMEDGEDGFEQIFGNDGNDEDKMMEEG